jgi:hypothetical protein
MKDYNSIGIILIILIAPLYIIYFSNYLDDKSVNILIAVAAIVSTYFLYLAFRESKKGNELKVLEAELQYLEKRVYEQEKISQEKLFSDSDIQYIESIIPGSHQILTRIQFSRFVDSLTDLLSLIEKHPNYQEVLHKYSSNSSVLKPEDKNNTKLIELSTTFGIIQNRFNEVTFSNFMEKSNLYNSIHYSSILREQKELFINRLNKVSWDFSVMTKYFNNDAPVLETIKNFIVFRIKNDGITETLFFYKLWPIDTFFYKFLQVEEVIKDYKVRLI